MLKNLAHTAPEAFESFATRAGRAAAFAEAHAGQVDSEARFPSEAIAALKAERLLGMMAPRALGGEDASVADVVDVCYRLGQACSSTAMIFAMHQVKAACVVNHAGASAWHKDFLARLASDQLLLASSTTEGKGGGKGRDHNPNGYSTWLAGGGFKGGTVVGATDELGLRAVEKRCHIHAIHATILHQMGIDYNEQTFLHNGRNELLTDTGGRLIEEIL